MSGPETTTEQQACESELSLPEHIREFMEEVADLKEAGAGALTDALAHWLTAQYVVAAKRVAVQAGVKGMDLKTLRGLIADAVALRRGDHSAERLRIEREQLDLNRELSKERMEKLFSEWAMKPENKSRICDSGLSADEKARRIRQIFGSDGLANTEEVRHGPSPETLRIIEKAAKLL
jgi:hypothetical protein